MDEPAHGVLHTVETELKYSGYIAQQQRQVDRLRDTEGRRIPSDFSYSDIPGLSREVQEKLRKVQPETLGQAGRIPGVTPAAVAVLDVYLSLEPLKCFEIFWRRNSLPIMPYLTINSRSWRPITAC